MASPSSSEPVETSRFESSCLPWPASSKDLVQQLRRPSPALPATIHPLVLAPASDIERRALRAGCWRSQTRLSDQTAASAKTPSSTPALALVPVHTLRGTPTRPVADSPASHTSERPT